MKRTREQKASEFKAALNQLLKEWEAELEARSDGLDGSEIIAYIPSDFTEEKFIMVILGSNLPMI